MVQHKWPTTDRYELTPLYDRPDLSKECIRLLNEEWPRSDGSREHSQAKSCRLTPPMSFLLLDKSDGRLIGHARLCLLPNRPTSCWVESVIIAKDLRGQGLGRRLMTMLEDAARDLGFIEMFLSTEDKVDFYERCGYLKCKPILHSTTATSVFPVISLEATESCTEMDKESSSTYLADDTDVSKMQAGIIMPQPLTTSQEFPAAVTAALPPPPPPPPPSSAKSIWSQKTLGAPVTTLNHQYMCKKL
ncbi:unnamed protein product [Cylicocyclus nassatus]|uniref:N-acetyltransferase domain-containing protein n=1 Tax=Cylicocyclus nassatus TaxID=53992 RepID=A0AA36M7B4_CYLNA|nr:unnamed protein product [Cylicocyclus nassatus]